MASSKGRQLPKGVAIMLSLTDGKEHVRCLAKLPPWPMAHCANAVWRPEVPPELGLDTKTLTTNLTLQAIFSRVRSLLAALLLVPNTLRR